MRISLILTSLFFINSSLLTSQTQVSLGNWRLYFLYIKISFVLTNMCTSYSKYVCICRRLCLHASIYSYFTMTNNFWQIFVTFWKYVIQLFAFDCALVNKILQDNRTWVLVLVLVLKLTRVLLLFLLSKYLATLLHT